MPEFVLNISLILPKDIIKMFSDHLYMGEIKVFGLSQKIVSISGNIKSLFLQLIKILKQKLKHFFCTIVCQNVLLSLSVATCLINVYLLAVY